MADEDLKRRLLTTFRAEAQEHRRVLTGTLLALEHGLDPEDEHETVQTTFRVMHTLKGAARSVGLSGIEAICHASELLLSGVVRHGAALTTERIDVLRQAVAEIAALLADDPEGVADPGLLARLEACARAPGDAPAPARVPPLADHLPPIDAGPDGTIRIDAQKLDSLLSQVEELLAAKLAIEVRAREAQALLRRVSRSCRVSRTPGGLLPSDLKADEAAARALAEGLKRDRHAIGSAVDRLLDETRQARMMPASTMLDLFPGMLADLARAAGKDVGWVAAGAQMEIDRRVLERVKDPLIHLVRNAIDHGIEMPAERVAAGKEARGRIAVTIAGQADGRVEIVVEDDGRGMDGAGLRAAAIRSHVVSAETAPDLDERELVELAFRAGLSTSPMITDVSGHGLGLAIVREQVESLEGRIDVDTGPRGTRVSMMLPASIATFRGVLVRASGQSYLLPVRAVEQVLAVGPDDIRTVEGRDALHWCDEPVPVQRLEAVLDVPRVNGARADEASPACVVAGSSIERAVLLVDEVLGDQEVLVKELAPPLVRVRHVAGAGLLGTGQTVLILRANDLVRSAARTRSPAIRPAPQRPSSGRAKVLVVDDAVTTRTMERNLLEAAGYDVRVAVDGADAWTTLMTEPFDLVVSDVDMPRLNGFELTARIRGEASLADLPVVLVTALEAREDKERGVDVGANAYVVKSSFDQTHLLEIIDRLGVVPGAGARR